MEKEKNTDMGLNLANGKFKDFLNLFGGFNKSNSNNQKVLVDKGLLDKYNDYFQAELYDLCAEMQVNGFAQTTEQKRLLKEKIKQEIIKDFSKYRKYKEIYGDFDESFKIDLFLNTDSIRNWKHDFEEEMQDPVFNKQIVHQKADKILQDYIDILAEVKKSGFIKRESYSDYGKKHKYHKIDDSYVYNIALIVRELYKLEKIISYDMKALEFDDVLYAKKIMIKMKSIGVDFKNNKSNKLLASLAEDWLSIKDIDTYIQSIDKSINEYKGEEKLKTISQLNMFNNQNGINREIVFKYSTSEIPLEVKESLKDIHQIYYKVRNSENIMIKLELDNKLKEANNAVSKYMSIDKEYRDTLTNVSGKSPYNLMLDSLKTIKKDFDILLTKNNQSLVDDLSVINRKVQAKKSFS